MYCCNELNKSTSRKVEPSVRHISDILPRVLASYMPSEVQASTRAVKRPSQVSAQQLNLFDDFSMSMGPHNSPEAVRT